MSHGLAIVEARSVPRQATRAGLRGEFLRPAQKRRRDVTVDWVLIVGGRGP